MRCARPEQTGVNPAFIPPSLIVVDASILWHLVFYLRFCGVVVLCRLWYSDHLMHVCSWVLDFGRVIVVASVFVMLLFRDLTTTESSRVPTEIQKQNSMIFPQSIM